MVLEKKAIHSFEDLDVYKLAREFSRKVNLLIKKLPDEEEYNLKSQMRRAKLSVVIIIHPVEFDPMERTFYKDSNL